MTKTKKTKIVARVQPRSTQKKGKSNKLAKKEKELTRLGYALRALGGLGGAAAGGLIGMPNAGTAFGTSLGGVISRWLGSGNYEVKSNSIVQRTLRGSDGIPDMHRSNQTIVVRHKEYLCEVSGTTAFTVGRFFVLQPGDPNTFPWLNHIAIQYQQYRIKGLVFHYVPTSGHVTGTNPSLGSVMIQTSYRANDVVPESKVEMLNEYWSSESVPSEPFCHPIECDPRENPFTIHYTRNADVPTDDSVNMYDLGKTYVATSGMLEDGHVVGDLWVTYEIELHKPIVKSNVTANVYSRSISGSSPTTSDYFPSPTLGGSLGASAVTKTVTFPHGLLGNYCVTYYVSAATSNISAESFTGAPTYTNCAGYTVPGFTNAFVSQTMAAGTNLFSVTYRTFVALTDPSKQATILLPNFTWTGTMTFYHLLISPL
jgi:hypothetical protein